MSLSMRRPAKSILNAEEVSIQRQDLEKGGMNTFSPPLHWHLESVIGLMKTGRKEACVGPSFLEVPQNDSVPSDFDLLPHYLLFLERDPML